MRGIVLVLAVSLAGLIGCTGEVNRESGLPGLPERPSAVRRWLAVEERTGLSLVIFDRLLAPERVPLSDAGWWTTAVSFSPQGGQVALIGGAATMKVGVVALDPNGNRPALPAVPLFSSPGTSATVHWLGERALLIEVFDRTNLRRSAHWLDVSTGRRDDLGASAGVLADEARLAALVVLAGGQEVLYAHEGGTERIAFPGPRELTGGAGPVRLSPDGRHVALVSAVPAPAPTATTPAVHRIQWTRGGSAPCPVPPPPDGCPPPGEAPELPAIGWSPGGVWMGVEEVRPGRTRSPGTLRLTRERDLSFGGGGGTGPPAVFGGGTEIPLWAIGPGGKPMGTWGFLDDETLFFASGVVSAGAAPNAPYEGWSLTVLNPGESVRGRMVSFPGGLPSELVPALDRRTVFAVVPRREYVLDAIRVGQAVRAISVDPTRGPSDAGLVATGRDAEDYVHSLAVRPVEPGLLASFGPEDCRGRSYECGRVGTWMLAGALGGPSKWVELTAYHQAAWSPDGAGVIGLTYSRVVFTPADDPRSQYELAPASRDTRLIVPPRWPPR